MRSNVVGDNLLLNWKHRHYKTKALNFYFPQNDHWHIVQSSIANMFLLGFLSGSAESECPSETSSESTHTLEKNSNIVHMLLSYNQIILFNYLLITVFPFICII